MMKQVDHYAVVYLAEEFDNNNSLAFFETKEALHAFITELQSKKTKTNQSFSYFSRVFPKGALYPSDYEQFTKALRSNVRKKYQSGFGFYVKRTLQSGKVKVKEYNDSGFDWQLPEWKEKGNTDICILNFKESVPADYYYDREIFKRWGEHEPLFA